MTPTRTLRPRFLARLRGLTLKAFSQPIPYEIRNPSGDWTKYYGKWFNQRPQGLDLNICWNVAAMEIIETQLQMLKTENFFSDEALKFFTDNGYIDSDGDFYLSRRFIAVISGVGTSGNDHREAWRLSEKYGCIPDKMFPFVDNYTFFDKKLITPDMYALGKKFLTYVHIAHEELGKRYDWQSDEILKTALFQAPLQYGIPIPVMTFLWNMENVDWDGSTVPAHAVEGRGIDKDGRKLIFDSYNPAMKSLSADYYIPLITRGIVTPVVAGVNPVSQTSWGALIYRAIAVFFGFNATDPQVKPA